AATFRVREEVFPHLNRKALLTNCETIATLIYFGTQLDERLALMSEIPRSFNCCCGATLSADVIIVRLAAEQSWHVTLALLALLEQLGPEFGEGPFRVPKMWSC